jgi:hypothetical protein
LIAGLISAIYCCPISGFKIATDPLVFFVSCAICSGGKDSCLQIGSTPQMYRRITGLWSLNRLPTQYFISAISILQVSHAKFMYPATACIDEISGTLHEWPTLINTFSKWWSFEIIELHKKFYSRVIRSNQVLQQEEFYISTKVNEQAKEV